jgi:sugar O-acyltransferase (sialic acid O-acetyltransferase NeuD family)
VTERRYVLWGSAGHAKVLASLIGQLGHRVVALFDNDPQAQSALPGVPLFIGRPGFEDWLAHASERGETYGLAAIGGARGRDRLAVQEYFLANAIGVEALIHPQAFVCNTACIGPGSQILAQSVVAADAHLGAGCIVNHRASVDHECEIGDGVHIAPGATLCGCVRVGANAMVGAGAVVLPRLTIGENAVVGAGAVVTRDVPAGAVVKGNPGRSAFTPDGGFLGH